MSTNPDRCVPSDIPVPVAHPDAPGGGFDQTGDASFISSGGFTIEGDGSVTTEATSGIVMGVFGADADAE